MKRQFLKFLLSVVRALVIIKRLFVWFVHMVVRFFVWGFNPVVFFVIVPLYQVVRRHLRRYSELSENPWDRRRAILFSRFIVAVIWSAAIFIFAHVAVGASSQPGVIPGSQSVLLTRIFPNGNADWHSEGDFGSASDAGDLIVQKLPTVTYRGGAVAYVYPYSGAVGHAPVAEEPPPSEEAPVKLTQPIQKYAVQRGDTIARLARKFSLKVETILWANDITPTTRLRPGDSLVIPAQNGVIYTVKSGGSVRDVARLFKVDAKLVAAANKIAVSARFKKGEAVLVPGVEPILLAKKNAPKIIAIAPSEPQVDSNNSATPAADESTAPPADAETAPPSQNDTSSNGEVAPPPVEEPTLPTSITRPPLASGEKMLWPTSGHSITQFFSGYHPGIDINGDYTDPVFAADDGTVIFSGWNNGGYGNMILIDHGNGIQTRYGHNSRVYVHTGQEVHRGDKISMIGTTGRSTGTHLHFEVMIGGRRVNPFKYVR